MGPLGERTGIWVSTWSWVMLARSTLERKFPFSWSFLLCWGASSSWEMVWNKTLTQGSSVVLLPAVVAAANSLVLQLPRWVGMQLTRSHPFSASTTLKKEKHSGANALEGGAVVPKWVDFRLQAETRGEIAVMLKTSICSLCCVSHIILKGFTSLISCHPQNHLRV